MFFRCQSWYLSVKKVPPVPLVFSSALDVDNNRALFALRTISKLRALRQLLNSIAELIEV